MLSTLTSRFRTRSLIISQSRALRLEASTKFVILDCFTGSNKDAKKPYMRVKLGLVAIASPETATAADAAAAVAAAAALPALGITAEGFPISIEMDELPVEIGTMLCISLLELDASICSQSDGLSDVDS